VWKILSVCPWGVSCSGRSRVDVGRAGCMSGRERYCIRLEEVDCCLGKQREGVSWLLVAGELKAEE
jgi:hypothetical protein